MFRAYNLTSEKSYDFSALSLKKKIHVLWLTLLYSYFFARLYAFLRYGMLFNQHHFEVRDSGKKGEGLFATKDIRKGKLVFVARGPVEFGHFEGNDCYQYPDWYMVNDNVWIDIQYPYVKVNHSCNPNLGIDRVRCFVSLRDIEKNEELAFDYSITDNEEDWQMDCFCGEHDCRKKIGAIQHVPSKYLSKSMPYIPKYFKRQVTHRL